MHYTKKILILILIITTKLASAQNSGLPYRQFFYNPYPFNPAYAGMNSQPELNLIYRKQWINFEDAPVTAGMSLQIPASQRVVLGVNLFTDKQVLIKNSTFMGSFIYITPIGPEQTLRFGLSGGVGINALNLGVDELNTTDPVITKAAGSNYYIDGNFGTVYTHKGLKVGFSFTDLFKSNAFYSERINKFSFSNLKNRLYSASYRFGLGPFNKIEIEPYVLYRQNEDVQQNYWEAASLIHFNQILWMGAGYNQNRGLALFLGMNVKEKLSFSYSYDFPPLNTSTLNSGSHEFQMSIRFGKKISPKSIGSKSSLRPEPVGHLPIYSETKHEEQVAEEEQMAEEEQEIEEEIEIPAVVSETSTNTQQASETIAVDEKNTTPSPQTNLKSVELSSERHYVVVGVFQAMGYAIKFVKQLREKEYNADIFINPENDQYYVYLLSATTFDEAKRARNRYRLKSLFSEAWIFTQN